MFTVLICGRLEPKKIARFSEKLASASLCFNYYPLELSEPFGDEPLDSEVVAGVSEFYKGMSLNYMAYLNCLPESNKKVRYSCSDISEDLTDFFVKTKNRSEFLDFVKSLAEEYIVEMTEELYLVFSDEWDQGQEIRLIDSDVAGVVNYFVANNGWDLWLYSVANRAYVTKHHYIPLVFKLS